MRQILAGHTNEATAYVVDDYPYGFRMRTKIRYWVESKNRKGDRICRQTLNPKTGRWNKPKKSTYSGVIVMCLNDDGHVKTIGLPSRGWATTEGIENFLESIGDYELNDLQKNEIKVLRAIIETQKHIKVEISRSTLDEAAKAERDAQQAETKKNIGKLFGYNLHKEGATY